MKAWYKSKTLWINIGMAVLIFAEANLGAVKDAYGAAVYIWTGLFVTVANVAIRFVTTNAIGVRDQPPAAAPAEAPPVTSGLQ